MDRAEGLHPTIELGELALDHVELPARVELAAQGVAEVVHAAGRAMIELQRAARRAAKRASRVLRARCGKIADARPRLDESRELVLVEQVRGDPGTTRTTVVVADGPRLAGRARAARPSVGEPGRDRALLLEYRACELALVSP